MSVESHAGERKIARERKKKVYTPSEIVCFMRIFFYIIEHRVIYVSSFPKSM